MAQPPPELVLERVRDLLRRLAAAGLRHGGRAVIAELEAAATSAHVARLVRIERELGAMATQIRRYADRDPTFRPWGWVAACNRCWLLAAAAEAVLTADEPDQQRVFGVHRRRYQPVDGLLSVQSVGASGWVTDSGFVGITVYLWAPGSGEILLATLARPSQVFGTDPRRLLFQPISEATPITVHELAHGAWILDDVRVSSDGRLSLHQGLTAHAAPPITAAASAAVRVEGFEGALDRLVAQEIEPVPTAEARPVLVEVQQVRPIVVDETRARASCEIVDRSGAVARVVVPLRPEHDLLLDNLHRLRDRPCAAVVGRASVAGGELRFDPWTALFDVAVKLPFRRAGLVQEVHLGLEPLPGEARGTSAPAPPRSVGPRDPVGAGLEALEELLAEVWSSGVAALDPDVRDDLLDAAERARELHPVLASRLEGLHATRSADELQRATAHVRLLSTAWSAERARRGARSPGTPVPRRGEDLRVLPIGVETEGGELVIHAFDARDGGHVVLTDRVAPSPIRPLDSPVASRLFQADVILRDVLSREVLLADHPVSRGRGRRVIQPTWHTCARSGAPLSRLPLPPVDAPRQGPPVRMRVVARRGPAGWGLWTGRGELQVEIGHLLAFDLDKRAAIEPSPELDVVLVAGRERVKVLRVADSFPTIDPGATRWPVSVLSRRPAGPELSGWITALAGGPRPDEPLRAEIEAARSLVGAGLDALRDRLRAGEALPPARVLWAWGRSIDPVGRPIDALELPVERIRAAIVGPLARWIRGVGDEAEALDAAVLLLGSREIEHVLGAVGRDAAESDEDRICPAAP